MVGLFRLYMQGLFSSGDVLGVQSRFKWIITCLKFKYTLTRTPLSSSRVTTWTSAAFLMNTCWIFHAQLIKMSTYTCVLDYPLKLFVSALLRKLLGQLNSWPSTQFLRRVWIWLKNWSAKLKSTF